MKTCDVSPKRIDLFVDSSFLLLHILYIWRGEQELIFSLSGFFSFLTGHGQLLSTITDYTGEDMSQTWETTWVVKGGEEQFNFSFTVPS